MEDASLQALSNIIRHGWPERLSRVPNAVKQFFPFRDELCVEDGIIMKGTRAVIPQTLHKEYLMLLHPVLRPPNDEHCQFRTVMQHLQRLKKHPDIPWSTVATDLFEWNGQHDLVLVDSYSGRFELDPIKKITSQCVINKLKQHFSVHGISHKLLSACGTQYTSQTFKDLAKDWDFTHVTSSPEYHQANGLSERAVQSAKHLLETSKRAGTDLFHNLNIRNVPRDGTLSADTC